MVFFTDNWRPTSFYPRLVENARIGLHTLILLDIKVKEPDLDLLARTGRKVNLPPRFMTVAQCCRQLIEVEEELKEGVCGSEKIGVGVARVGSSDMKIVAGTLAELADADLGAPLHSVVVIGRRGHEMERDFLEEFAVDKQGFRRRWDEEYGKSS